MEGRGWSFCFTKFEVISWKVSISNDYKRHCSVCLLGLLLILKRQSLFCRWKVETKWDAHKRTNPLGHFLIILLRFKQFSILYLRNTATANHREGSWMLIYFKFKTSIIFYIILNRNLGCFFWLNYTNIIPND